ncbi:hypothetical protein [Nocardioides aequoreus]|uniref:hypothetical protein n=1 Tax=Nocardioides aequoreus TaxID=397278 RepID=UPI0004C3DC1A|nr:hypothetical protein [Nocardioides aequoreus]
MTDSEKAELGAPRTLRHSQIDDAVVALSDSERISVEFRIQDLVRRLVPEGDLLSSCGGCNGCMGCSM